MTCRATRMGSCCALLRTHNCPGRGLPQEIWRRPGRRGDGRRGSGAQYPGFGVGLAGDLGKGLDDFLTRPGAGRGPDLYAGATFRPVDEALVAELQALADRLLQEEQDRRDAAAAAAGGVDESQAIGGDDDDGEYDRLAGDALRAMIDETQEVGSPGHIRKMEMEEAQEFAVDAAKVAVRRIVDRPQKELLLDDDLRRAFLAHVETLGEAECTRLRIYKPTIELFRKVDTLLSADGFATPARRALVGYLVSTGPKSASHSGWPIVSVAK